jgi:hypothetical protein
LAKRIANHRIEPFAALAVSVVLWLVSLWLPALGDESGSMHGLEVLLIGWMGPITFTFAWYGNLFWLVGAVFMARRKAPPVFVSLAGLALSATCLLNDTVASDAGSGPAMMLVGAYVWLGSFLPQIAATLTADRRFPPLRS